MPSRSQDAAGIVVPLRSFTLGKARLAAALSEHDRETLARSMAECVVNAAGARPVAVVSSSTEVVAWARKRGHDVIDDPGSLDAAAAAGRSWAISRALSRYAVVHADLPLARSFDAVLTIRNYHDLKNPAEALAEIKRLLKPGGTLGIIDSRTASGRDEENHRIADDVIVREVLASGFSLAGISQMLSNPKDDYTKGFWDARWIVDQSCLKFTR